MLAAPVGVLDGLLGLVGFLVDRSFPELAQEGVEGLGQFGVDFEVVGDEDALEEGLVELAADLVGGIFVGALAVSDADQGALEVRLGCLEVAREGGEAPFDGGGFGGHALLLALEEVERDRVCVVSVKELLAFAVELSEPARLDCLFAGRVFGELLELLAQVGLQVPHVGFGELDGRVVVSDCGFCLVDVDRALFAAVLIALTTDADEVGVGSAVAFLGIVPLLGRELLLEASLGLPQTLGA